MWLKRHFFDRRVTTLGCGRHPPDAGELTLLSTKNTIYSNLDFKDLQDNYWFWKVVKPLPSGKVTPNENITLVYNEK